MTFRIRAPICAGMGGRCASCNGQGYYWLAVNGEPTPGQRELSERLDGWLPGLPVPLAMRWALDSTDLERRPCERCSGTGNAA